MPPQRSFASYALPFFGFMIAGWYGLSQVVQSKRDVRVSGRTNTHTHTHTHTKSSGKDTDKKTSVESSCALLHACTHDIDKCLFSPRHLRSQCITCFCSTSTLSAHTIARTHLSNCSCAERTYISAETS